MEPHAPGPKAVDAIMFSRPLDSMGFDPLHPAPPSYVSTKLLNKRRRDFDRLFLAQELLLGRDRHELPSKSSDVWNNRKGSEQPNSYPIWAMEFSKDGKFLAAGGQDNALRVWHVLGSPEERISHEQKEDAISQPRLGTPVFQTKPVRTYLAHSSTILDISWSKNNFLLSSAMDRTVRLWHVSRPECLCTFKHADLVPSVQFHPRDDRFFLAGSLDMKLRLWSIPDKNVAHSCQMPDMITAVSFTPDGTTAIAGTLTGVCQFFETDSFKYQSQVFVKSNRGRNTKGRKITGIQTFMRPANSVDGEVKIMISSNDSRIRVYDFRSKIMEVKFKGHQNYHSQIRGHISDDCRYIACGSEDKRAYVFSVESAEDERKVPRPVEFFEANSSITTVVLIAPTATRQSLSASRDPIYDMCNPPPVTLISRAEVMESVQPSMENGSNSRHRTKIEESPAYLARSLHNDGSIIVTADSSGSIKVFRQDCAFAKRRYDPIETGSFISRRTESSGHNRSFSIRQYGQGRPRRDSTSTENPSDRILSWRQDVYSTGSADDLAMRLQRSEASRSQSPRKSLGSSSLVSMAAPRHDKPLTIRSSRASSTVDALHAPDFSKSFSPSPLHSTAMERAAHSGDTASKSSVSLKKLDDGNPLWMSENQSYVFWHSNPYGTAVLPRNTLSPPGAADGLRSRQNSGASTTLTSEEEEQEEEEQEQQQQEELMGEGGGGRGRGGDEMTHSYVESSEKVTICRKCGGRDYKSKMIQMGTAHSLFCTRCSLEMQKR
jgi:WD repeat-containing protein 44